MCLFIVSVVVITHSVICGGSDIYHINSKTTFLPDYNSTYFGYSVVLTKSRLYVGAPKAQNRLYADIASGDVFECRLKRLHPTKVMCGPIEMDRADVDFLKHDMWFGASIATVSEGKLVACAPRWTDVYKSNRGRNTHYLAYGACYTEKRRLGKWLTPLKVLSHLAYKVDNSRKEYGPYGMNVINYYAYGQAGMSIKATEKNVIIGAPGLLQWTGGIIDFRYNSASMDSLPQPINNPYNSLSLGPDDYFGYSVEAGIFEPNGSILYVAGAPRSADNHGKVSIFEPPSNENAPLSILVEVKGPHLGSYFGAALCVTDLNGDGRADLLVGAPNFIMTKEDMPYDQGAVFIYLNVENQTITTNFDLRDAGHVSGSEASGARFGSAIAALGDIDRDGYDDIAVGAPYENDGVGAVYIYKGSAEGLSKKYLQRIVAAEAKGFGISISKGVDYDSNNCNDMAVGAYESGTAYIYHCIPTIKVEPSIRIPDAMNLPKNLTEFLATFCVNGLPNSFWPKAKTTLRVTITIDPNHNRTIGDQQIGFRLEARPGIDNCKEVPIEVLPTANLAEPFLLIMDLEPSKPFLDDSQMFTEDAGRLSEDSTLSKSFLLQLMRDCGDDLVCTPKLHLTLEAAESVYTPGLTKRLGIIITVYNEEEPAYDVQVLLRLPLPPKRVPMNCVLEGLNMTCDTESPVERDETESWGVELEYTLHGIDQEVLGFEAELKHPLYIRDKDGKVVKYDNEKVVKHVHVTVVPKASFNITGKSLPNNTMTITREKFYEAGEVLFTHYFEVKNLGPSDWLALKSLLRLPENVTLSHPIKGCNNTEDKLDCEWPVPVNTSVPIELQLKYNLSQNGKYLEEKTSFNATSTIILLMENQTRLSITTELILEPATPIWPVVLAIVSSSIIGLALLAGIIYGLHKYGFFSRKSHEELKRRKEEEENSTDMDPGCSTSPPSEADESTLGLISDDSD
ncbi:FG-GAP repeat domain-containing protein [Phthorimaea operculella]|nr:FG-GAP repeat domain-containing protein [Phthorimaea operculella]